jgi:hypothetical protein
MVEVALYENLEAFRKNPSGWKAKVALIWNDRINGSGECVAEHILHAGQIRSILQELRHVPCSGSLHIEKGTFEISGRLNVFTAQGKEILKELLQKIDNSLSNLINIPGSIIICHLHQSLDFEN